MNHSEKAVAQKMSVYCCTLPGNREQPFYQMEQAYW